MCGKFKVNYTLTRKYLLFGIINTGSMKILLSSNSELYCTLEVRFETYDYQVVKRTQTWYYPRVGPGGPQTQCVRIAFLPFIPLCHFSILLLMHHDSLSSDQITFLFRSCQSNFIVIILSLFSYYPLLHWFLTFI